MTPKWSSTDLKMLTQYVPQQGIQSAALHLGHTLRETYEKAVAMGAHIPPNGTGPWPRRSNKVSTWPASDEHILRQEYQGSRSCLLIAEILERTPADVAAMSITLGLAAALAEKKPKSASVHDLSKAVEHFEAEAATLQLPKLETKIGERSLPSGLWTKEMDAYLKDRYHKDLGKNIAAKLGVTYYQTTRRARELGISIPTASWSRDETIFLLEHLQTEPLTWVAEQLGRTMAAVSLRPKQLGIFPGWTRRDDKILLKEIKLGREFVGKLINRPAYAVEKRERFLTNHTGEFSKAKIEKLFEAKGKKWIDGLIYLPVRPTEVGKERWTEDHLAFLRKNYPIHGSTWCAEQLGVTGKRVRHKAISLGLTLINGPSPWSAEDDRWLFDNVLRLSREECAEHLNRTVAAVSVRASIIGAFKERA